MSEYQDIAIETYLNPGEPSSAYIRARPLPGQGFSTTMNVECSKRMRKLYAPGTKFKLRVKLTDREGGGQFLYSHHSWPFEVLTDQQAADFIKRHYAQEHTEIPDGITKAHLIAAIRKISSGIPHKFGQSTGYDVLFEGKRLPPKAVVGVAAAEIIGRQLGPYDFKGGLKSKCFQILENNGFSIVTKGNNRPYPEEIEEEDDDHKEGAVLAVKVNRYERDAKAREKCIRHHGATCQVCEFDFEDIYGEIGEGFIHVHHIVPLSKVGEEYTVDPINDLVPVCPNCHSMLHKRTPPFSIEELREIMSTR